MNALASWTSNTHIGHSLFIEIEDDGSGRPRWILRRRARGGTQAMVISGRSAQRLVAGFLSRRAACPPEQALDEAARALEDEVIRCGLYSSCRTAVELR